MMMSDEENCERSKMYRIHTTVMEMLNDRGYLVSKSELSMSKEQFIAYYGGNFRVDIRRNKRRDETDQVLVSFTETLGVTTVRNTKSQMEKEGVHRVIFVVQNSITSMARALCAGSVKVHFELFQETELLANIAKHKLVPEHELLTEEDKKILLQKYKLKVNQLPGLQVNDPVARYFGLRRGEVVKITRSSETAGRYVTYRHAI